MKSPDQSCRRKFIKAVGIVIVTALVGSAGNLLGKEEEKKDNEVSPPEDLMREHGVLKRILLVYGEALRRIDANEDLPPEPIAESARIIRDFVEDYHEKLEENFLFPRFKKANKQADRFGGRESLPSLIGTVRSIFRNEIDKMATKRKATPTSTMATSLRA